LRQWRRGLIVLRSRRRLPPEQLSPFLVPDVPRAQTGPAIDWPALFGNSRPVQIEVGFGKGLFLLNASAARPDINFFGIEIVRKCVLYTATRLALRQLPNVKLACADARVMLSQLVSSGSVQALHVYFPDPWWKKRHHKRRLFTGDFAASAAQALQAGGALHVVTDVEEYFQVMLGVAAEVPSLQPTAAPAASDAKHDLDYLTNFERKFRKEGRPIYRAAFVKNP
jgi:tRNA (guanine-N7-)-methyltransferase